MKAGKDCRYVSCGWKKKLPQLLFASFRQKCCVAEDLAMGFMGSGLCNKWQSNLHLWTRSNTNYRQLCQIRCSESVYKNWSGDSLLRACYSLFFFIKNKIKYNFSRIAQCILCKGHSWNRGETVLHLTPQSGIFRGRELLQPFPKASSCHCTASYGLMCSRSWFLAHSSSPSCTLRLLAALSGEAKKSWAWKWEVGMAESEPSMKPTGILLGWGKGLSNIWLLMANHCLKWLPVLLLLNKV